MSSEDKKFNKTEFINLMKENNVKYKLIISLFVIFLLVFSLLSPKFIDYINSAASLKINLIITNPFELILNYFRIGFFVALSIVFPIIIFQLSKLKLDFEDKEDRNSSFIYALILYGIILSAFFFTLKILFPMEIFLLYGFNFFELENNSSFTGYLSLFFVSYFLSILCFSIPMVNKYSSTLPVLDYKDFENCQNKIYYILGILAAILVFPLELFGLGFVFIMLCFFHRLYYKLVMRNKDE